MHQQFRSVPRLTEVSVGIAWNQNQEQQRAAAGGERFLQASNVAKWHGLVGLNMDREVGRLESESQRARRPCPGRPVKDHGSRYVSLRGAVLLPDQAVTLTN